MIRLVFIGNDKKCFAILKMSIPNIKISLIPFNNETIDIIRREQPEIILVDLDYEYEKWPQYIKQIQILIKPPAILITGKSILTHKIIKAIKLGVIDYIPKPFNPENLFQMEKSILFSINSWHKYNTRYSEDKNLPMDKNIIGCSNQIISAIELLSTYAESEAAILILGESGVGKNLFAQTIHFLSKRSNSVYKAMHTAALPPTLIESELYGTEFGAFTDAKSRPGYFESANQGTLFLDEIGELPLESQVKLLRILEEKSITRIGGNRQIPIDVRIISATNINIHKAVKSKLFREDLYYRINTLIITIPPLRERKEDIPLLVDFFLKSPDIESQITNSGLNKLLEHTWPGNIRELKNTLLRSRIHAGPISPINESHITFN
jgi:two-component system, NtrC family, response regulator AtoC